MRGLLLLVLSSSVAGCGTTWTLRDEDGDGKSILDGDCADSPEGGADIGPEAAEVWYDGIDQNCDGLSDFDQDGDGFDAVGSGDGTDCWDDPNIIPDGFDAINGFPGLTAATVNPDALEVYYDGIDANCDGVSDFDQDLDGFDTSNPDYRNADGAAGDDCFDSAELDEYPASGEVTGDLDPVDVNPDATDTWYDGTDANCDGESDYDQDGDGYNIDAECDDLNAAIFPDPDVPEVWYNDIDENCDGNRYDKDLDGFESLADGDGTGTDCWDDFDSIPADFVAINGRTQPTADAVFPGAEDAWYDAVDADCAGDSDFDQDLDGYDTSELPARSGTTGTDCEDEDAEAYPGASEIWYNGVDNDCNGSSDYDADGDGFDSEDDISTGTDCDDVRALVNTAMNEDCGTTYDDNCDDAFDLLDATDCTTFNYDGDSDTYGTAVTQCWCEPQVASGYDASNSNDCDDASSTDYPGATETVANSDDEDCDGVDSCYTDSDNDNFGTTVVVDGSTLDCTSGTGAPVATDCDDVSSSDYPGAAETTANGDDEDCDGVDSCYTDSDNDNFGTTVVVDGSTLDCVSGTGAAVSTDCDDTSSSDYPGASETVANGDDEDCDGVDSCYTDSDNDGYGTTVVVDGSTLDCVAGTGAAVSTDCDDTSSSDYPGASETVANGDDEDCDGVDSCYTDSDNDNYGTTVVVDGSTLNCTTGTGAPVATDCDDTSSSDYPGATETVANGDDEDCDGVDSCYTDSDNDGYGTTTVVDGSTLDCVAGTGAAVSTDCDDTSSSDYPGASETVANGDDEDCDGVDSCYTDSDNDGYGTTVVVDGSTLDCVAGTGAAVATDCDDTSSSDYPGATETVANGDDEDCDSVDSCYTDSDNDGYGTTVVVDGSTLDCVAGTGAAVSTDCDDTSSSDYPGASETVANGDDEDCDGVDSCYTDADNDNYGTTVVVDGSTTNCTTGTGAPVSTDCNDASSSIYPTATEACNDVDDDCDGAADDGVTVYYTDADADTYGTGTGDCSITSGVTNASDCDDADGYVYPGATEYCDGQYNNCTTSGTWTSASENNLVTKVSTGGVNSAVTVSASTALDPTGTYYFCSGTYNTRLTGSLDTVSVIGYYGAGSTIIDNPTASTPTVSITNGSVTLDGLTIRGGTGSSGEGGGVFVTATSGAAPTATLIDCVVDGNTATKGGGIAAMSSAWVLLDGTTVHDNDGTDGGGAYVAASAFLQLTNGSSIWSNAATDGGGIFVQTVGEVTLEDSTVYENLATSEGGGIYLDSGTLVLDTSLVYDNDATDGGGIWMDTGSGTCTNGGIYGNTATGLGGGVYIDHEDGFFAALTCDFNGTSDNSPDDVNYYDGTGGHDGSYGYGATAIFTCTLGICS